MLLIPYLRKNAYSTEGNKIFKTDASDVYESKAAH